MAVSGGTALIDHAVSILHADSYRVVPWKNGGGVTCEIAASDPAEPLWRLSIATIERDGPFSDFRGYDRTIVPIEGKGIELRVDEGIAVHLNRPFHPFAFRGEWRTTCKLIDGPVRDFNVMTRRDAFAHAVEIKHVPAGAHVELGGADITFATVFKGGLVGASVTDTVRIGGGESVTAAAEAETILGVVRIFAVRR